MIPRGGLELPESLSAMGIHGAEPAFHGSVKDQIATSSQHSAVNRQVGFFYTPNFGRMGNIPSHQLALIATRTRIHAHTRAKIWRAGNVVHGCAFIIHAGVVRRNVEQTGARRKAEGMKSFAPVDDGQMCVE